MEWLVPQEVYIQAGVHLGTRVKTKAMKPFISKVRPDGLAIINIEKTNERLAYAANLLSRYEPNEILVVGRRETAKRPIEMFAKYTKVHYFAGRYPPGVLTNPKLENFIDPKIVVITDPIVDINALKDAYETNKVIIAFCDTNNTFEMVDLVIPANNKGARSLALLYWILAREYLRRRGILPKDGELEVSYEEFMERELEEITE